MHLRRMSGSSSTKPENYSSLYKANCSMVLIYLGRLRSSTNTDSFSSCRPQTLRIFQSEGNGSTMDAYHGSCRLSASEERLSDTARRSTIVARVQSGECAFVSFRYDADANHEPCLKQGHRAHWLLAHGYLKELDSSNNNEHDLVLVQHGKSKFLGAFSLADLFRSNNQLLEADPKRRLPSEYCLPTDASLRETLGSLFISVAEK